MSTYSNAHFVITGKACRGCKHCEGGAQLVAFNLIHWTAAFCTGFLSLLAPMFFKRCLCCGHSLYLNKH